MATTMPPPAQREVPILTVLERARTALGIQHVVATNAKRRLMEALANDSICTPNFRKVIASELS